MKKRIFLPLLLALLVALSACGVIPGMGGSKSSSSSGSDGQYYLGDEIVTAFFKYTVNSASSCDEYDGYTPSDGNKLIVVEVYIKNTSTYSMPMFISDFELQWGSEDDDYAFPVALYYKDEQVDEYEIPINGSATTQMVYEAPADVKDFAVDFLEYFENEEVGDIFFTYFTVE